MEIKIFLCGPPAARDGVTSRLGRPATQAGVGRKKDAHRRSAQTGIFRPEKQAKNIDDATYNRRTSCTGVSQMSIRNRFLLAVAVLLPACVTVTVQAAEASYDVVITNGHIVDGTGSP